MSAGENYYLDRRGVEQLVGKRYDWEKEILGFSVAILNEFQLVFSDLFQQIVSGLQG